MASQNLNALLCPCLDSGVICGLPALHLIEIWPKVWLPVCDLHYREQQAICKPPVKSTVPQQPERRQEVSSSTNTRSGKIYTVVYGLDEWLEKKSKIRQENCRHD
jgi:hypothetical protein